MKLTLIKKNIVDFIGDKKVKAAVFFSYNFDVDFFENYLLPILLPSISFTDNKIQNALLWRRYSQELPPITVICDYHAKGAIAPNLGYDVITKGSPRQCFHSKISFILTDDETLLVLNGSNNLTYSGWCHNIEAISIETFDNKNRFPNIFLNESGKFLEDFRLNSDGWNVVKKVFINEKSITKISNQYWLSANSSFESFIRRIIEFDQIEKIEIISPYIFGENIIGLNYFKEVSDNICISIPYSATDILGIKKDVFIEIGKRNIRWKKLFVDVDSKVFRFNHSKVYRLKGRKKMYTIIGSVNLTNAAWDGMAKNGNFESAVAYVEDTSNWVDWLIDCKIDQLDRLIFDEKAGDEFLMINRTAPPEIAFVLNWKTNTLSYERKGDKEVLWWLPDNSMDDKVSKRKLTENNGIIYLTCFEIERLTTNPIITVLWNKDIFTFYPKQVNNEKKPLPAKYRLNEQQIFDLWNDLAEKPDKQQYDDQLISKLSEHFDLGGDFKEPIQKNNSLNQMAIHLSGLITLENALFGKKTKKSFEKISYYLFYNNVETLPGYIKLIKKIAEGEGGFSMSFLWLLIKIIQERFYTNFPLDVQFSKTQKEAYKENLDLKKVEICKEVKQIEKFVLNSDSELKPILTWVTKQIKS